MPNSIPNLLGGKTLTGVLPIDRQPPMEVFLPQHSLSIVDIEACIDDPSLAPLGHHVVKRKTKRKAANNNKNNNKNQVKIQHPHKYHYRHKSEISELSTTMGTLMLRRQELDADQLAKKLDFLYWAPLAPFLQHKDYYDHIIELDISRNQLSHLPAQITKLKKLRNLNLSSNMFTKIPTELYLLKELEVLNLSQNSLEIIPDEMPSLLPNLVTLRVAANSIYFLPQRMNLWRKMRHLQLGSVFGGNQLTRLPDSIVYMPVLEELDISNNLLRSLPSHFIIPSLTMFNASHNKLDFIPKSISHCIHLKSLNISKNHLTTLPASLVELTNLELFDISENFLCIVPADILERMHSTTLLITGNPLTIPPSDQQATSQFAYARILKQMTQRVVTYSPVLSPSSSRKTPADLCGPNGTGCLPATSNSSCYPKPSAYVDASTSTSNTEAAVTTVSASTLSYSSISSSPSSSSSNSSNSSPSTTKRSSPSSVYPIHFDEDASIDRELSYHAQKLNINGSRPSTPPLNDDYLIGTSRSAIVQEYTRHSECTVIDNKSSAMIPIGTPRLFNSLLEIATRHLLKSNTNIPLDYLPPHLQQSLCSGKCRFCAYCQGPFIKEWVSSVQVKSFSGHPAVVRKVRFCSTECWLKCLSMEENSNSKSVICVHRAH